MKQTRFLYFIFLFVWGVSCSEQKKETVLIPGLHIPKGNTTTLSGLLTGQYEITPLETTPESLIGRINKIKKFKKHYYILSNDQWIFRFNENGKFISLLDKKGEGPGEYLTILDFDIYENSEGATEIWVGEGRNIKIFDAEDGEIKETISYPFAIHKFRKTDDNTLLLLTGQNEHSLTLSDRQGEITGEYLKKEIPFLLFRSIQFIPYHSHYIYQLGLANAYVGFDTENKAFYKGAFSEDQRFLSEKQVLDMFEREGQDFILEANKGNYINTFFSFKDILWVTSYIQGKRYLTKLQDGEEKSAVIWPSGPVKNDLFDLPPSFLYTINTSESDDSILLYIPGELIEENEQPVYDKNQQPIKITSDDNPCLIEFY